VDDGRETEKPHFSDDHMPALALHQPIQCFLATLPARLRMMATTCHGLHTHTVDTYSTASVFAFGNSIIAGMEGVADADQPTRVSSQLDASVLSPSSSQRTKPKHCSGGLPAEG
jgi:hypothetical protein